MSNPVHRKKKDIQPVEEGTANKAGLKKNKYPLPEEKDVQYNHQPEFINKPPEFTNKAKQKKEKD
jgi:hypothetical protein